MIWVLIIPVALAILATWTALRGRERDADAFDEHSARLMRIRDGR